MSSTRDEESQFRCTLCHFTGTSKAAIGEHFLNVHMEAYVTPVSKANDESGGGPAASKDDVKVETKSRNDDREDDKREEGGKSEKTGRKTKQSRNVTKSLPDQPEQAEEPKLGRGMRRRKRATPRHILRYTIGHNDIEDRIDAEDDDGWIPDAKPKPSKITVKPLSKLAKTRAKPRAKIKRVTTPEVKRPTNLKEKSKPAKKERKLPVSHNVFLKILKERTQEWFLKIQEKNISSVMCENERCGTEVMKRELEVHMNCHSPNLEGFRCPNCSFMCLHWTNMRVHYRKTHDPLLNKVCCDFEGCSMVFPRIDATLMQAHVMAKHLRSQVRQELLAGEFDAEALANYSKAVEDESNNKTDTENESAKAQNVEISMKGSDAVTNDVDEKAQTKDENETDVNTDNISKDKKLGKRGRPPGMDSKATEGKPASKKRKGSGTGKKKFENLVSFFCSVCLAKFKTGESAEEHQRRHFQEEDNPLLHCTECPEFITHDEELLRLHVKESHKSLLHVHRCDQCMFSTNRFHDLRKHLVVHTGSKDYMCDKCGTCTTTPYNLRVHYRRYHATDEEKNFHCFTCDYRCADKGILKEHIRSKHGLMVYGDDYDKARAMPTYPCSQCDYVGKKKVSLEYHMRIHTENRQFKCHLCPYASKTKNNLVLHIRTHEGMQPLQCPHCDFRGATNKIISEHVMCKHAGVRPYMCNICGWTSSYHGNMWKHVEGHQKELGDKMPANPVSVQSTDGHMVPSPLRAPTLKKRGESRTKDKTKMKGKRNRSRYADMPTEQGQVGEENNLQSIQVSIDSNIPVEGMKDGLVIQVPVSSVVSQEMIAIADGISEDTAIGASALSRLAQAGEVSVREIQLMQTVTQPLERVQHHEMMTYSVPPVAVAQQIIAGGDMAQVISEQQYHAQQQQQQQQQSKNERNEERYQESVIHPINMHEECVPTSVGERIVHAMPPPPEDQSVQQLVATMIPHDAELVMSMMQAHQPNVSQQGQ